MTRARQKLPAAVTLRCGDGRPLAVRCAVAQTPWTRLRGLLGRRLDVTDGLWIRPCNAIHMLFMSYAIDAVFLDGENRVIRVAAGLAPWRFAARRGARSVIELPAGTCARVGLREGDTVTHEAAPYD